MFLTSVVLKADMLNVYRPFINFSLESYFNHYTDTSLSTFSKDQIFIVHKIPSEESQVSVSQSSYFKIISKIFGYKTDEVSGE